jgi:arylsulfatase A-like enzyme/Tfp pilus assembly protein PilF
LACALAVMSGACQRATTARGYNLLVITIDTVRADHIGAYGAARAETPTLDRLAGEGVRFEVAKAAAPLTLPSHATLFTGLLPPHHGLRNNGAGRLPDRIATLATRLQQAGYRTAAFVGAFVLDRRFGLGRGFELYDDEIERNESDPSRLEAERRAAIVVDRASRWLDALPREDARPFFAWVHLYDAHAPYEPPEPYATRHRGALYDGEIAYVDEQIGRLLSGVERGGRTNRTLIVVTSDHGEALGEHGELTHGVFVYESSLRVPLILNAPRVLPARTVRTPVGLADVAPTIAALLDQPFPEQPRLDGRDLASVLQDGGEPEEQDLYAESEYPRAFGWSGLAALARGSLKYIDAPSPELYDLASDAGETTNIGVSDARAARLKQRLDAIVRGGARAEQPDILGPDDREQLATLGYVAAGRARPRGGSGRDPKETIGLFRAFEEANWALQAGRLSEATVALERLIPEDEANPVFVSVLAHALRRQGQIGRAVDLYRRVVAAAPDDADARYDLAVALHEAGRPAEALAAAEEAVRRDPGRPEAHNALGIALFDAGRPAEALAEFDRAIHLDPRSALANNNRGNVLRAAGKYDEAADAYGRAIELAPRYVDPLNGLGSVEVQRKRPHEALQYFERALALDPDRLEIRLNKAIALDEAGQAQAAIVEYRAFMEATSGRPEFSSQRQAAAALLARIQARTEAGATR